MFEAPSARSDSLVLSRAVSLSSSLSPTLGRFDLTKGRAARSVTATIAVAELLDETEKVASLDRGTSRITRARAAA